MDRIQFFSPQIYILSSILYNSTVCNSQLKCIKFKDVFSKTTSTGILEERDFVNVYWCWNVHKHTYFWTSRVPRTSYAYSHLGSSSMALLIMAVASFMFCFHCSCNNLNQKANKTIIIYQGTLKRYPKLDGNMKL